MCASAWAVCYALHPPNAFKCDDCRLRKKTQNAPLGAAFYTFAFLFSSIDRIYARLSLQFYLLWLFVGGVFAPLWGYTLAEEPPSDRQHRCIVCVRACMHAWLFTLTVISATIWVDRFKHMCVCVCVCKLLLTFRYLSTLLLSLHSILLAVLFNSHTFTFNANEIETAFQSAFNLCRQLDIHVVLDTTLQQLTQIPTNWRWWKKNEIVALKQNEIRSCRRMMKSRSLYQRTSFH